MSTCNKTEIWKGRESILVCTRARSKCLDDEEGKEPQGCPQVQSVYRLSRRYQFYKEVFDLTRTRLVPTTYTHREAGRSTSTTTLSRR